MSEQQNPSSAPQNDNTLGMVVDERELDKPVDTQPDSVVRFLFEEHGVRGEIAHLHESVATLLANMEQYPDCIKQLMLELAAAAVLMAATLKTDGTVTVQIQGGKGADAINFAFINIDKYLNFYGNVSWEPKASPQGAFIGIGEHTYRHRANPDDPITFLDLVGDDSILVISAFPEGGNRYQGIVPLEQDNLAECLELYFRDSEQLPTSILLNADVATQECGGILLQIIPEVDKNLDSLIHLSTLAASLTPDELYTLSLNESLRRLFWNDKVRVFAPEKVRFKCICSHERILNAVRGLPLKDLKELSEEPDGFDMNCNSCGKNYHVSKEEIESIYAKALEDYQKESS